MDLQGILGNGLYLFKKRGSNPKAAGATPFVNPDAR